MDGGDRGGLEPERFDLADDPEVVVGPEGFGDVAVAVESVDVGDVVGAVGGGDDDDGDPVERGVRLDEFEDFASVASGEVEVQEDEVGGRGGRELAPFVEEIEGGVPVHHDVEDDPVGLEGLADEIDIARLVLDEQDIELACEPLR